ncbi:MAG: AAA family ATPase, partial [Chloroflexota bacterium]
MFITNLKIVHYKSFLNSGEIHFRQGVNVIVGKNNAGKTALFETLSLSFENKPHLSEETKPQFNSVLNTQSFIEIECQFEIDELEEVFQENKQHGLYTKMGHSNPRTTAENFLSWVEEDRRIHFNFYHGGNLEYAWLNGEQKAQKNVQLSALRLPPDIRNANLTHSNTLQKTAVPSNQLLANLFETMVRENIFVFRAERFNVGQCEFGNSNILEPDASNLPEVLNYLQSSPNLFEDFNQLVNYIFPDVIHVSVRPHENKLVKVFVQTQINLNRDDLAIPLQESGTGIGQVLAILYIVVTARSPKVVVIDEPQSFLHPDAIYRMFEVLNKYPNHQYIISTHSPIIISASNPQNIIQIKKENGASKPYRIDKIE